MTSRLIPRASNSERRRASRVALALLGSWSVLVAGRAFGEPGAGLTLRWQAPAGCPQQAAVRDRIKALTGTARSTSAGLQADGTITQTGNARFHLKLVTRSGRLVGERSLDASSCENLTGAAAVSIALLMRSNEPPSDAELAGKPANGANADGANANGTNGSGANANGANASGGNASGPSSPTANGATTPNPANSSSTPAASTNSVSAAGTQASSSTATAIATHSHPDAAKAAQPETRNPDDSDAADGEIIERPIRESPRKWRVLAQMPLATMSIGPLPKPSWGVSFAGGASFEKVRLLLGGSAWLRQNVASAQSPDFGADVDRLTGTLKACPTLEQTTFEVAPCLVLSLEHITARGTGVGVTARSEQATWLAIGAGAQGRLHLKSGLALLIGVDVQIQTARPVLSVDGAGEVGQLGPAAFTASVGPEWIL